MEDKNILMVNGSFYDLGTRNKNFLEFTKMLKSLGYENWYAPLEIRDITLAGVVPSLIKCAAEGKDSDPDLVHLRKRILTECNYNIWYYFREVLQISFGNIADAIVLTQLVEKLGSKKKESGEEVT